MNTSRPTDNEYVPYFGRYIGLIQEPDFLAALNGQPAAYRTLLGKLQPEQGGYRYEPGKWSLRECLGHVIDTERVFAYRALAVSRNEQASLPSFEQDDWAKAAGHDGVSLAGLLDEFAAVRQSNIHLLQHMSKDAWERMGTVNQHPISTRGLVYILVGHAQHHLGVLKQRYGAVLSG
jgi:hypothetical protein